MIGTFARALAVVALTALACSSSREAPTPSNIGSIRSELRYDNLTWTEVVPGGPTAAPAPRTEHTLAFDAARGNVVLFGGYISNGVPLRNDTWIWDGTTWTQRMPTGSIPSGRRGHAMAYDSVRQQVVLFGGSPASPGDLNDTWLWNGTSWTQAAPSSSPSARSEHVMAFDSVRQQVVLFGGSVGTTDRSDTWLWNGTTWTQATPSASPSARSGAMMAFDSVRGEMVLFGGYGASIRGDTWVWDGTNWLNRTPSMSPSARYDTGMTYDAGLERVVLYGGDNGTFTLQSDTWLWDGSAWTKVTPMGSPGIRTGHRMIYDAARGKTLMWGGFDLTLDDREETWLLYPLGVMCTTNAQCPAAFCVDGVCCTTSACGACETCAGASVGRCTAIVSGEDPDTCATRNGKSCSASGCKSANGQTASSAGECASGNLVDGVCCDSPCAGTCQACRADLKASNDASGVCGAARGGTDPRESCSEEPVVACGRDGLCDDHGMCRLRNAGTACGQVACVDNRATGRVCDGLGACTSSVAGVQCGLFACEMSLGCRSSCEKAEDCGERAHCENGECVANEGAACDGDHTITNPDGKKRDCGRYKCEGATCKTSCTRVDDCVYPAQCSPEGLCVAFENTAPAPPKAGCSVGSREGSGSAWLLLAVAWLSKRHVRGSKPRRREL